MAYKGNIPWNKGLTKETSEGLRQTSEKMKGENNSQYGKRPWNKGLECSYQLGEKNPAWKGGKHISRGYMTIRNKQGKYIRESRILIEKHIGRKLDSREVTHHLDGDKTNNNIENLHLFLNQSKHMKYHFHLRSLVNKMLSHGGD